MIAANTYPHSAIVLAAGLGKRMRPITDTLPKPLVPIADKPMLDHALDRLQNAGIGRAIVNVHHLAGQIEAHLANRAAPQIFISDERALLLETGGGAKKALPLLGKEPFIVLNSDTLWAENGVNNLQAMMQAWRPDEMDLLLLIVEHTATTGYDGAGDFTCDADGRLLRRSEATAPFVYAGASIVKPELFADTPDGAFSLNILFDRAIARRRLFGHRLRGHWLHVGTPDAIAPADHDYRQHSQS
ncbi:MAG: nucleotidyltransferase family protein [Beijerinckiaceae bacterium]